MPPMQLPADPRAPQVPVITVTHQFTAEQHEWYNTLSPAKRAFVIGEMERAAAAACQRVMRGAR